MSRWPAAASTWSCATASSPTCERRVGPLVGIDHIDGRGGALIPGLHDHHLHLAATAADRVSVHVGPDDVVDAAGMGAALRAAADGLGQGGWLRATRYHEEVAGDLDRDGLDHMVGERPTRVQHRTGAMWILNSAAMDATALDDADHAGVERDAHGRPTGRVFGADAWLRDRLPPTEAVDLAAVGTELARYGVTGVTDATPTESVGDLRWLAQAVGRGDLPQSVVVTGGAGTGRGAAATAAGARTGQAGGGRPRAPIRRAVERGHGPGPRRWSRGRRPLRDPSGHRGGAGRLGRGRVAARRPHRARRGDQRRGRCTDRGARVDRRDPAVVRVRTG